MPFMAILPSGAVKDRHTIYIIVYRRAADSAEEAFGLGIHFFNIPATDGLRYVALSSPEEIAEVYPHDLLSLLLCN
jgi:hypothetical protein